jgi:membrane-associated protein TcaA
VKYCKQCGSEMEEGKDFCTNCGTTMAHSGPVQTQAQPETVSANRSSYQLPSFFKSRKFVTLTIIIVILAAGAFIGYQMIESKNHPSKIVLQFEKAVDQKNTKEVAYLLNSGQEEMEVKDTDTKMLLTYFKDNPDILADTLDSLKKDANILDDGGLISTKKNNGVFLNLTKTDKKWFVFTQYGIHFKPIYFKTSSNQEVAEVTIDNKKQGELKENEEKTFGPFLPVKHEIIGIYKGQYGTAEIYETIDPADYPERKIMVELDASGNSISLDSNNDEAIVFINGESTGKTVKDLDSLGPVSTDGSVKIYAEITEEGQTLKSDEIPVTEAGQTINLYIDDSPILEARARTEAAKEEVARTLSQDKAEIENVVYEHYSNISYGYFSSAYDLFSSSRKKFVSFAGWEEGFANNISNDIKGVKVESVNGNQATASFEMVSRDYTPNRDILVQTWAGKWHLTKENSFWKLDDPEISKINERLE